MLTPQHSAAKSVLNIIEFLGVMLLILSLLFQLSTSF